MRGRGPRIPSTTLNIGLTTRTIRITDPTTPTTDRTTRTIDPTIHITGRTTGTGGAGIGMRNNNRLPSRWLAIAAAHLLLVAFGASQIRLPRENPLANAFEQAFGYYGVLSGATNGYGFFKEIHSELKARFVLKNRRGEVTERRIETELNREAALRMNNLVSLI